MPWQEVSIMSQRKEFVMLAQVEGTNFRELCRRFHISHVTGYKWLGRYLDLGEPGLADASRRPLHSPTRTSEALEEAILKVRDAHPVWGPRKIRSWLQRHNPGPWPSPSTISAILHRYQRISPVETTKHQRWQRFERPQPNDLWQMDFKGHFPLSQGRCYPLTVLDDYSRYALGLQACANEQGTTVKDQLTAIFRNYGLPESMLMDNGNPWGAQGEPQYTTFQVWLMRLGIRVYHGRPFHPQTQGKDERFHRTLNAEVLQGRNFRDLEQCQRAFDAWRPIYNWERPHQALEMAVPGQRYRSSPRPFPESLPPVEYGPEDVVVRKVQADGTITFHSSIFRVGNAFRGLPVALRPTSEDGVWDVFFMTHLIAQADFKEPDV